MITPSFSLTATERVLPKLALDFTTANLDSRVTFTRTTSASNPATYVNNNGVVTNATNNQPRFDYDPLTGVCLGLLIEEARTNDLFPSGAINSGWTAQNATIDATPITAPDGTNTAYKFVENTANSTHRLLPPSVVWVNGTRYSISFFAKAAGRTSFALFDGSIVGTNVAVFDLATKTATITFSTGSNTCSIKEYKDGWFLCTYTQTSALTSPLSTYFFRIDLRNGAATTYTGDGVSGLYVWGGQRETGGFSTSYIPTTSAAATRNADVATMTGTNFSDWFNASEGSFVVKCDNGQGTFPTICCIDGLSSPLNRIVLYQQDSTQTPPNVTKFRVYTSGTLIVDFNLSRLTKYGFAGKTDSYTASANGGNVLTDTSGTFPTVTKLFFYDPLNFRHLNGHIQSFYYWTQRITNNEVQAFSKG